MESFSRLGWPVFAVAGLSVAGLAALTGLVSPLASAYLAAQASVGGAIISRTSEPLVRVRFVPLETARLTLLRDGSPAILVLHFDPACPSPSGLA